MTDTNKTLPEMYPNLRTALAAGFATVCVGGIAIAATALFSPVGDGVDAFLAATFGTLESAAMWLLLGLVMVLALILIAVGLTLRVALEVGDASGHVVVMPLFRWLGTVIRHKPLGD